MQEELIDRFGELPLQGQSLLATPPPAPAGQAAAAFRSSMPQPTRSTLQFGPEFSKNPPIEPIKIINLIQNNRNYKLAGQDKISLLRHCPTLERQGRRSERHDSRADQMTTPEPRKHQRLRLRHHADAGRDPRQAADFRQGRPKRSATGATCCARSSTARITACSSSSAPAPSTTRSPASTTPTA